MSERRACKVVGVNRSSLRYRRRRGDDEVLRERPDRSGQPTDGGSATAGSGFCSGEKVWW